MGFNGSYSWFIVAKLANISPISMAYDTYTELANGFIKQQAYLAGPTL